MGTEGKKKRRHEQKVTVKEKKEQETWKTNFKNIGKGC